MNLDEISVMIKSIVVSSKYDVLVKDIDKEFKEETGIRIPYTNFKHQTLESFLKTIEGVYLVKGSNGETTIKVKTENARHIQELVREQKSSGRKRRSRGGRRPSGKENQSRRPSYNARKGNFRSNLKPQSNFKSSPKVVVPPKIIEEPKHRQPFNQLTTTQNASQDVRGLPFVVVSNKEKEYSDISETETESESDDDGDVDVASSNHDVSLRITVSKNNRRLVEEVSNLVRKENNSHPVIAGYTLLGDDYFYNYAKEYLRVKTDGSSMGMCQENLTVEMALKNFRKETHLPKKIIVLLGGTDILNERGVENIITDYYKFINELLKVIDNIIVCTVPLFIDKTRNKQFYDDLSVMNELIKFFPEDIDMNIEVIDLYDHFAKGADLVGLDVNNFFSDDFNFNSKGLALLDTILKEYLWYL